MNFIKSNQFNPVLMFCGIMLVILTSSTSANEAQVPLMTIKPTYNVISESCSESAKPYIDQGINWFYGFQFANAFISFKEALKKDEKCAVALWGMALNAKGNPNSRYLAFPDDPKGEGLKAIQKALKLSLPEKPLIHALVNALSKAYLPFNETQENKDQNYTLAMRKLMLDFPHDPDINTLYAEAFMTENAWDYWTPDGAPRPGTKIAIDALNKAIIKDQNHPGANHLYIHIYEDSQTPQIALPHAERLANTMPSVAHMVHMPAHIYVRTGRYEKSIKQNLLAITAAQNFLTQWELPSVTHLVSLPMSPNSSIAHADDFIWYAQLEQGNYEKSSESAARIATRAEKMTTKSLMAQGRYVLPILTDRIFMKWEKILLTKRKSIDSHLIKGIEHFVMGSAFVNTNNIEKATKELEELKKIVKIKATQNMQIYSNTVYEILSIGEKILSAELAVASGETESAIALFYEAISAEDSLNYMEPPEWRFPVRRELGSVLLQLGRSEEAIALFWEDLRRHPENGWSLHGVLEGNIQINNQKEIEQATDRLKKAWAYSDTELKTWD